MGMNLSFFIGITKEFWYSIWILDTHGFGLLFIFYKTCSDNRQPGHFFSVFTSGPHATIRKLIGKNPELAESLQSRCGNYNYLEYLIKTVMSIDL